MPLVLPYPGHPTNGDNFDATPVLANINAIAEAIQSFDGSQVQAATIQAAALAANANPQQLMADTTSQFIVPGGCVWSAGAGLVGSMTSGNAYILTPGGLLIKITITSVASYTFTASKDTYIDVDYNGNLTYTAVANGAASPALAANSLRVAKVITGASITSVVQNGFDTLFNLIYPTGASGTGKTQLRTINWIDTVQGANFSGGVAANYTNITGISTTYQSGSRPELLFVWWGGMCQTTGTSSAATTLSINGVDQSNASWYPDGASIWTVFDQLYVYPVAANTLVTFQGRYKNNNGTFNFIRVAGYTLSTIYGFALNNG